MRTKILFPRYLFRKKLALRLLGEYSKKIG